MDASTCHVAKWVNSPVKRFLDVLFAVPATILLLPLLTIVAIGIRLSSPGPILFRHPRAGRDGQPFEVLKLRTMRGRSPGESSESDDAARLTTFGRFLRRFSIDELPQLMNVIRGEMSIIGPRPLPMEYIDRYTETQRCRLLARPGLTGLSQMRVRNAADWEQKLSLDAEYISQASVSLDFRILLGTVRAVLKGSGVSAPGHATMPEFRKDQQSPDR